MHRHAFFEIAEITKKGSGISSAFFVPHAPQNATCGFRLTDKVKNFRKGALYVGVNLSFLNPTVQKWTQNKISG